MEHLNCVFETEAKTYRGDFTERVFKWVRMGAEQTDGIWKNYDCSTNVFQPSGSHPPPDWTPDVQNVAMAVKRQTSSSTSQRVSDGHAEV